MTHKKNLFNNSNNIFFTKWNNCFLKEEKCNKIENNKTASE